jgi:hypothetical protein
MSFGSSLFNATERRHRLISGSVLIAGALAAGALAAGACAGSYAMPAPRQLVVRSGARVFADRARLAEIDVWVREHQENIVVDPSFLIVENGSSVVTYPWQALTITGDTASVLVYAAAPEAGSILSFYGYYHLMDDFDRLDEVLPEAVGAQGYELERAILSRVSDAWLYGRSAFDMAPYGPLDELMFSHENGYLDAFVLTARPEEFDEAHSAWLEENPGRDEEYRQWFRETFEMEPPGLREPERS